MKPFAALVLVAAVLTACAGDDDTAPTVITTEAVSTTIAATTPSTTHAPDPTTTVPSTTPDTTSTTTEPPTTTAPTPTTELTAPTTTSDLDPIDDLAAAIQRDLTAGNELLSEVLADPSAGDAEERLRRYFAGDSLDIVLGFLDDFRTNDFIVVSSVETPSRMVATGEPALQPDSSPPRVVVRTCEIDSDVVMGVLVDSGIRFPLDDEVYRYVADSNLELIDGVWKLVGGELVTEEVGVTTCE